MAGMANEENNKVNEVHVRKENEQKKNTHVEVGKPGYHILDFFSKKKNYPLNVKSFW